MDTEQQLLFANRAGIKVTLHSFAEFSALLEAGSASPLDSGASFSRSLASASGIDTPQELEKVLSGELESDLLEQERLEQLRREQERLNTQDIPDQTQFDSDQVEQERLALEWLELERAELERMDLELPHQEPGGSPVPATNSPAPPEAVSLRAAPDLPMGAWLEFHDGDTPLQARLAVHDPDNNSYIFVNRHGIKMRQLSTEQLLHLIDNGLVEVLETGANFKDEISRLQGRDED
jgi:hypothetical protein